MKERPFNDDFMELGDTGVVPEGDGFFNTRTNEHIAADGKVYNEKGDMVYDPSDEPDRFDDEDSE